MSILFHLIYTHIYVSIYELENNTGKKKKTVHEHPCFAIRI
jgi:hypothetical protein